MEDLEKIRHSLAHILASAVLEFLPKTKLAIGPVIKDGFYYDMELPKSIGQNDLSKIESRMKELIKENQKFSGKEISKAEAKKIFKGNPYKLEIIEELVGKKIKVYKNGKFLDLCRGGHVKNTSEIDPNAFKLTKIAGAYWRGNEKNKMLTRIYGVAFATEKELLDYLKIEEEAEKRDHRKLGEKLDLFVFSDLVGPGLPLFTPKGTIIRDLLDNYVWQLRKKKGYQKIDIPHITKKDLYQVSGHWDKFKEELFRIKTREGHEFALKPMNCPHHIQIFNRKKWSYRDLPQKYASTTKVYRDEQTGELFGLTRVRSITQDDAHIFCDVNSISSQIFQTFEIIKDFYGAFDFSLKLRLSLRDKKQAKNYLGDSKVWNEAESHIKDATKKINIPNYEGVGEAAFYGPKLDFMATDSLGREWQIATIQLDIAMPERFKLEFTKPDGKKGKIIIIHCAIMGSIERFLSLLIEHYAGAFPLWLSPIQVALIPISEKHRDYALKIKSELENDDIRVELRDEGETLGKRIREAEIEKIPYILVVGDKEITAKTMSVRKRGTEEIQEMNLDSFAKKIKLEIESKKS